MSTTGDDVAAPEESEENTGESDAMLVEEEKTAEDALPGGIIKHLQITEHHNSETLSYECTNSVFKVCR